MHTTAIPTRAELVERAAALVPLLREQAGRAEREARLTDEVIAALTEAGIFRMRLPARFGGYECDTSTLVDVSIELGRGDGSVAFDVVAWWIMSWNLGLFPDEVQDEIFADPSVRICGGVNPSGVATPTDGGVILNGRWHFVSGAPHSQWDMHSVQLVTEDGGWVPATVAVPMSDLTIVDDWHTAGLRATGSVSTIAKDLFVPQERVLPMEPVMMRGEHKSKLNADSITWKLPFVQHATTVTSSSAVGMAKAAREAFFEKLPSRKISYTGYERQAEAPLTHLQVAEAAMKIDEAEFHVRRAAERLDTKVLAGEQWTIEERALSKLDAATACLRAKEAVDVLNTASGGSSIYWSQPMQRIERDIRALNLNGVLHPNSNAETYGRVLCGLEPNTTLL